MSFRFRLATLLKLREQTRDERRLDVAKALEAERVVRERIAAIENELAENEELVRRASRAGTLRVDQLTNGKRYAAILKMQLAELRHQLTQVEQELERRRAALQLADAEVKTLEKLREKQQASADRRVSKLEDLEIDAAALRGYARESEAPA